MSSGGTGGGGIIIIHARSLKTTGLAISDLQAIADALPDGDLKTAVLAFLASLPGE